MVGFAFGEKGGEFDLFFTFEEVCVVEVIGPDPRAGYGRFLPGAGELRCGGIDDDAGQVGGIKEALGGRLLELGFEG